MNFIAIGNGFEFLNADRIRKVSLSECGDVVQVLAWYDNDIENCEVIATYNNIEDAKITIRSWIRNLTERTYYDD